MMKVTKYFLFGILSLSIISCEQFLDIESSDFLTLNNAYNTEQQLNGALTGVYDAMGGINATKGIYSDAMLLYGGLEGDLAYYGATNPSDGPQIYQFSATNKYVEYYWNALYLGIDRANVLLANMDNNPKIDNEKKKIIRGEALFLRGYYYFLLVQTFGGVPLKLEPSLSASYSDNIPKSSVIETYNQILLDMKAAEPLVRDIDEIGHGGRVSKSAVQGMVARVHLYMAGYPLNIKSNNDSVIVWTKKVINNTKFKHGLNSQFSEVFINYAKDKYDIKESIWEVEFYGNKSGAYDETGIVGIANGPASSNEETGRATGLLKVTRKLYDLYQPWDLRRGWSIANFTYNSTGPNGSKTFRPLPSNTSIYNHCGGKFRREYEVITPKVIYRSPINFPILRFADILLMYAEAENEVNGPTVSAIDAVNAVRQRSFAAGIKSITVSSGGQGYTSVPTVSFSGGGGNGVAATAKISSGKVTSISLNLNDTTWFNMGSAYTTVPSVIISGGGGTGAIAVANIYSFDEAKLSAQETLSKEEFRKMIIDERARELNFEGLRKCDLIRWGIFVETMQSVGTQIDMDFSSSGGRYFSAGFKNVTSKNLVWPIPARELTLNKSLIQNSNW